MEVAAKIESANPTRRMVIAILIFDDLLGKLSPYDWVMDWGFEPRAVLDPDCQAVDDAFQTFEEACRSPDFERDDVIVYTSQYLKVIFDEMVKDWGWGPVLGLNGLAFVASRLESKHVSWDRFETRAVRTWTEAHLIRGELCASHHLRLMAEAKSRGWESLALREDPDRVVWLMERVEWHWRRQPGFGTKHPSKTDKQFDLWHRGMFNVRELIPPEGHVEIASPRSADASDKPTAPPVASPISTAPAPEPSPSLDKSNASDPPTPTLPELVTLNQAAAMVHNHKRTLERFIKAGKFPRPTVEGGAGRAAMWDWSVIRPWLEDEYNIPLPAGFPPIADTHKRTPTDNRRQPHVTAPLGFTIACVVPLTLETRKR